MNKKLFSLGILLLLGLMLSGCVWVGGIAIIMVLLMAPMDIPIDMTMVTWMTTILGDKIAHWANDFGLKEGKLVNLGV
jgi:hypothetical protein